MPRMTVYSGNAFAYHGTIGLLVAAVFPCLRVSFLTHILGHPRRTETEEDAGLGASCTYRPFLKLCFIKNRAIKM